MTDIVETAVPTLKRGTILGTASTWKICPFADASLDVFGLNDGYILGVPRASAWFDLHPFPEMVFRTERRVQASTVPAGAYLRPHGHLDWLKSRPFPVWLHDCEEAECASLPADKRHHTPYPFPDWPNAQKFPFRALRARYGSYFSSTPAWMLAWMLEQVYTEVHIYGIHLATEWEYIRQRPNLEFLIGMALGRGTQFVIPDRSSLLKGKFVYAIEPKPDIALDRVNVQIQTVKLAGQQLQQALAQAPWYGRAAIRRRLEVVNLELLDARQEQARLQALAAA